MKVTDSEALEAWRKLKKIIFSTLFVIAAIPIIGLGGLVVASEIRGLLASFGIFFNYHIPEYVHQADTIAVVCTLLIVIAFPVFVVLKDVIESFLPEKHLEHTGQHAGIIKGVLSHTSEMQPDISAISSVVISKAQSKEGGSVAVGETEPGTEEASLPVQIRNSLNKNASRRRRRQRKRSQKSQRKNKRR